MEPAFFNYINFIHGVSQFDTGGWGGGGGESVDYSVVLIKSQSQLSPSEQPLLKETKWKEQIGPTSVQYKMFHNLQNVAGQDIYSL